MKVDNLKIGAIHYKVAYIPDLKDDKGKLDGRIRHVSTEIQLEATMNHQATVQTLLHEALHATFTQMGHQDTSEDIVDALAYGVYQLLRDNPELMRMIRK